MDLQNGEIDDEGVSNRWQLGGTAGMERFRLAIVSIRNEGVVTGSDFQIYVACGCSSLKRVGFLSLGGDILDWQ
jgi:hypothetical protein